MSEAVMARYDLIEYRRLLDACRYPREVARVYVESKGFRQEWSRTEQRQAFNDALEAYARVTALAKATSPQMVKFLFNRSMQKAVA